LTNQVNALKHANADEKLCELDTKWHAGAGEIINVISKFSVSYAPSLRLAIVSGMRK